MACLGCSFFTCGTDVTAMAGDPKGAMLTHENVVSDAAAVLRSIEVSLLFFYSL